MKIANVEIDLAFEWIARLIDPIRFVNEEIGKADSAQSFAVKVCLFPLFLMLFLEVAAIAFAGLKDGNNSEVVTAIILTNLLSAVIVPLLIWLALFILRSKVPFKIITVSYAPAILFAPLIQVMSIGQTIKQYNIVKYLMGNSETVQQSIQFAIRHLSDINALPPASIFIFSSIILFVNGVCGTVLMVVVSECIVHFGKQDSLKVYFAVGASWAISSVPQQLLHLSQIALITKIATL